MTDVTEDLALGEVNATEVNGDNGGLPAGLPMPRDPDLLQRPVAAAARHDVRG